MQINKINTYNSRQKADTSFGNLLNPDLSSMAEHEIRAFTKSIPQLKEWSKDVNILVRGGTRMIPELDNFGRKTGGRVEIDAYNISFYKLGSENKTLGQKIKEFFKEDKGFLTFSEPTTFKLGGQPRNEFEMEGILKDGVAQGKAEYKRFMGLEDAIQEAKAKLTEISGKKQYSPPTITKVDTTWNKIQ